MRPPELGAFDAEQSCAASDPQSVRRPAALRYELVRGCRPFLASIVIQEARGAGRMAGNVPEGSV